VLICFVEAACSLRIGALVTVAFERGHYAYVGSAQGGIRKRVARHLSTEKRRHWHIDWLLDVARVERVAICAADRQAECATARELGRAGTTIRGFGSSDCRCPGHLIRIEPETAESLLAALGYRMLSTE
jgi:Uri superfamily endonuclease